MVSRGGFHVGNGINWKGQVFSKMRNHTVTNRMTVIPFSSQTWFLSVILWVPFIYVVCFVDRVLEIHLRDIMKRIFWNMNWHMMMWMGSAACCATGH